MGERHLTIDARVAATRERSYICPPMKIDFESRARALRGVSDTGRGMQRDRGGVGVVKTLVSRPGIRVSRHNAGALIDRARDQPAPKAMRLFFNVRELKKLINDVMRPARLPGQETRRGGGTMRIDLRGERFAKPRIFINRETAVGTLCFPNDGRSFGKYCTTFKRGCDSFFPFLRENCDRYANAVDFNWSFISPVTSHIRSRTFAKSHFINFINFINLIQISK